MSLIQEIRHEVDRAARRLGAVVRRGLLQYLSDSYFGQVECYDGETFDDVELWQQFGLTSRPPVGSEIVLVKVGGMGEGAIAIASNMRNERVGALDEGDSVLHATEDSVSGQARVHCKAEGDVDLHAGSGDTVNVGGTSTSCVDFILKGSTFNTAYGTFLSTMAGAKSVWDGASPQQLSDVLTWIDTVNGAFATLATSQAAGWLATIGKVK